MLGIEPGSSNPQSSPLPLCHRGWLEIWFVSIFDRTLISMCNQVSNNEHATPRHLTRLNVEFADLIATCNKYICLAILHCIIILILCTSEWKTFGWHPATLDTVHGSVHKEAKLKRVTVLCVLFYL